jgi:hypothetical protein
METFFSISFMILITLSSTFVHPEAAWRVPFAHTFSNTRADSATRENLRDFGKKRREKPPRPAVRAGFPPMRMGNFSQGHKAVNRKP